MLLKSWRITCRVCREICREMSWRGSCCYNSLYVRQQQTSEKKKKKNSDLRNGGILLEELIASFDGKTNPICCFSSDQILKATENFSDRRVICTGYQFIWYRGVIEERTVSIKKWLTPANDLFDYTEEVYRDISVSCQMSGHRNSLKLIGCCLEFDYPALICEYTELGPLNEAGGISSGEILPWKIRLKIAKEIANALTYLHTTFPETIIHRYINPTSIFIDRNWTVKLCDFELCVVIPEGELYVESFFTVADGYIDRDYVSTQQVTEKVDIYSFGVLMLVLLFGRAVRFNGPNNTHIWLDEHVFEVMKKGGVEEIVDKEIWNAPPDDLLTIWSQVALFLTLALRCVRYKKDEPVSGMIEVAKELKLIEKLSLSCHVCRL